MHDKDTFSDDVQSLVTEYRGLLTEREREVLSGNAGVSDNYVHQIRHRVREKIEALETDVELLSRYHPDLAEELYDTLRATEVLED